MRGLIALGEFAFREFIPFIYKFNVDDVPESFWNDFSVIQLYKYILHIGTKKIYLLKA